MRIAVVSNTAWYLFNFRLNLMHSLIAAGHSVVAVAPEDVYCERILTAGVNFENVQISGGGTNPFKEILSVIGLWRVIRRHRIDLVLSYTPKGNLYSALACILRGVPFVPNVSGLGRAFIRKSPATLAAQVLYKLTFGRAYRVFFQNLDDMGVFVNAGLVHTKNAERLPGSGVDLTRFVPAPPPIRSHAAPVFLLVARMLWDKGVGEYVEAARKVRALHPECRFQLLGFLDVANPSAISRKQMDEWVTEGVVDYLGKTDDVRPHIFNADCVILPSYREGVPRTLLEAAATARPVITTDAPGCRDTVIDGQTGFLCRPADTADLVEKILKFVSLTHDQRASMGRNGRAFAEENFSEHFVIERYLKVVGAIRASYSNLK
ncbi:glycosyltransferase family 4 protein [Paucibacter sp. TC2R-5]|uniref:glycosyltransferase family 4 protein n=1 Tax=Paucibacter sp. TC2R-5 TaxID=2893555 RepID=UPI0021E412B6|nr:glycosyltransferase family 4 protein [Paucibacter sp. TC2R-5]MCV2361796.1 glycosyltransferase family 4 protein [Paucibacter sp. TC2R-5]